MSEKFHKDCVYCAFECFPEHTQGNYCNYFNQKIYQENDDRYDKNHKAFRSNNECEGFTLLEAMKESFERVNNCKVWVGAFSRVELEE